MVNIKSIHENLDLLLDFLLKDQNLDGSFDSFYLQPFYNPDLGWMKYPTKLKTAFDIASISLPLRFMKNAKSKYILFKTTNYLKEISLSNKFWSYSSLNKNHIVPYDVDSTALASYVVSLRDGDINNKEVFIQNMDANFNYKLWLKSTLLLKHLPILQKYNLFYQNYYIKRNIHSKTKLIRESDNELAINCNVLLYLGESNETKLTWEKIMKEIIENRFDESFYINNIHSFYIFSRLVFYGKRLFPNKAQIKNTLDCLVHSLNSDNSNLNFYHLLISNAILFLELPIKDEYENIILTCYKNLEIDYSTIYPYYSSSKKTDTQPGTNLPNTYFGSPAITCSLYIEFLNLYRFRMYGKYYGE